MSEILMIVPSNHRPQDIRRFVHHFLVNSNQSDLLVYVGLDDNFWDYVEALDEAEHLAVEDGAEDLEKRTISLREGHRRSLVSDLNLLAYSFAKTYKYIGFATDRHVIRTKGWDDKFLNHLDFKDLGIAYANDSVDHNMLPSSIVMDSTIIRGLGYMAPPELDHMYYDNFWYHLGRDLGSMKYFEDVIINNKDNHSRSREAHLKKIRSKDGDAWRDYCAKRYRMDLGLLKRLRSKP